MDKMEKMLSTWDGTARKLIDKAYSRIIKVMFDVLEAEAQQFNVDSKASADEKESLNIHILTVENMHHFYGEIRARKVPSLEVYIKQAKTLYEFNLEAYCKAVIRKPLGKLMVIISNRNSLMELKHYSRLGLPMKSLFMFNLAKGL